MRPTIVGVATGSPDGGVAIVRLSGPRAGPIAIELGGDLPAARHLGRRALRLEGGRGAAESGAGDEDALVAFMPGPNSFTGEDVVELHVHGGGVNVNEVVGACLELGAQAAGPGDFSRRAFEHGRLSLAQSEGIAALIGAKTRAGAAQARRLVAGELGAQVRERADALARLRTEVEAYLDFPEDVDTRITRDWRVRVEAQASGIEGWLSTFEAGRRARELCRVVLAGPPNAGKSSLMNALLGQSRALVADVPGTTRDFVDARLELGRHAVQLVDTAGLRETSEDQVEMAGMRLSKAQLEGADLLLWVCASGQDREALPEGAQVHAPVWRICTKIDLETNEAGSERPTTESETATESETETETEFGVSVNVPETVDALRMRLHEWVRGQSQQPWVGLARHRDRAQEALAALRESVQLIASQSGVELLAFSLQVAQARLDEIEGRRRLGPVGAEVLNEIFSNFCIGK